MSVFITNSENETEKIGEEFAKDLPGGSVVAMYGDLGAGKTAFIRGMARGLGIDARVSSPTFTPKASSTTRTGGLSSFDK